MILGLQKTRGKGYQGFVYYWRIRSVGTAAYLNYRIDHSGFLLFSRLVIPDDQKSDKQWIQTKKSWMH